MVRLPYRRLALYVLAGAALAGVIQFSSLTSRGFLRQWQMAYSHPSSPPPRDQAFLDRLSASALELTAQKVKYDPAYFAIPYPGGDVPPDRGVCTDVVIRAYRKLGVDLQLQVHQDMKQAFALYPKIWRLLRPDPNIDHRRVPNLMVFFKRHGQTLPITQNPQDYQPGDIVVWDLGRGLTHIGLVAAQRSLVHAGYQIVHNICCGQELEDRLFDWKIIGHFRYFGPGR